ncbi:MAG: hypothetical protein NWP83_02300 [Spirosomaceae bacterium]|nr:hypothetical protein [Spirosomataceae bacterium]
MFDYQFPTWLPILFFAVLLTSAFLVGTWLNKTDRDYEGIGILRKIYNTLTFSKDKD